MASASLDTVGPVKIKVSEKYALENLGDPFSEIMTVRLEYRPPYRFAELLAFFRERALTGVEVIDETSYARTVRLKAPDGSVAEGWMRVVDDPEHKQLVITMPNSLAPCMPHIVSRVRRMFDVDCDPQAIASGLAPLEMAIPGAVREGTRLPGCFDPFETACRAVLGQQISVAAANKLAARLVESYGTPVGTGIGGASRVFPTPEEILALNPIEDALGPLGVIKTRSRVIAEIARMLVSGELDFDSGALATEQIEKLLAIKGVGPWTANYIAMRALSHPDAFLESDAGVAHALHDMTPRQRLTMAEAWRPWRSYAVICLWNSLGPQ